MELLYNIDSYIFDFDATVENCEKIENGYKILLSKTAFFPEQGGQYGDIGIIGDANVIDTQIENGIVYSICDKALEIDKEYECHIDKTERYRKMQNHTGEHILSGIAHKSWGCENTGFHLSDNIIVDFDIVLNAEQIKTLEFEANKAIWANKKINIIYPAKDENYDYRSKKEIIGEQIRLVEIEEVDMCACCAPHVNTTAEVGMIKILSFMKHRGGTRLFAVCGMDTYKDYLIKFENTQKISNLLSIPANDVFSGINSLYEQNISLKREIAKINYNNAKAKIDSLAFSENNICVLFDELDSKLCVELVNIGKEKCNGMFVLCTKTPNGLRYTIGSNNIDLKEKSKEINSSLQGRGGGRSEMISGTFGVDFCEVEKYFNI